MGCFWFLKLGLKCIDLLAWPLLALGYPLCASIQAIENDSYSDTKNLISYWILLSLIYLFEYAFMKLLEWFQLWPYFKLMIIFWLVIPDFGRSFLVYKHLVHSCISMNPQEVISRIENRKKLFVKKENFLLQAEKYIKENGTEALEKLISSENMTPNLDTEVTALPATEKKQMQQNMARSLEAEAVKAVPATEKKQMEQNVMHSLDAEAFKEVPATEKKQLQQTNGKSLHIELKDLEVIDKKEVPAGKNANPTAPNLALNEITSSGMVETNRMAGEDVEGGKFTHSAASKKVQKEWTCAICQVTTTSEKTLNSHMHGRKHMAACEALKLKAKSQHVNKEQRNPQISNATQQPEKSILTDAVKQRTVKDQQNKAKGGQSSVQAPANKTDKLNAKNVKGKFNDGLKAFIIIDHKKMQSQQKDMGKPVGINVPGFRCNLCNVRCTSEVDMASHLKGRKHLAQIESSYGS